MTQKTSKRQLAAIMFADMVGYTALMQEDEKLAKVKRDKFRNVLEQYVQLHDGKVLQYYGDGALCTFSSAIESASAALKTQLALQEVPEVLVRIGLHTGDIVFDDEGIFGDGVNVASRIESLSTAGSIMLSDKLYDDIKNHPEFSTRSMGEFELKNVKRKVEVFAMTNTGLKLPKRSDMKGKLVEKINSIAVMPFVNTSSDPENEYFSDGVTEELINALTCVDGLQVISRSSSFSFKGTSEDIRVIGKKLNVSSVLEGSIRKSGNKVRVSAQLVNTSDGYHIWSNSFDRQLEDIFDLQDEISRKIANSLREKLGSSESQSPIVRAQTDNVAAYNDYLLGLFHQNKWALNNVLKAIDLYEKVIKAEPNFSLPYAGLAHCYNFVGSTGYRKPTEAFTKADAMAEKSLELDPKNIDAYLAQASIQFFYKWDWAKAVNLLNNALEINPKSSDALLFYSLYYIIKGDYPNANTAIKDALVYDPLSVHILRTKADILYFEGKYEQSIEVYNQVLEFDPNYQAAEEFKGWAYLLLKDYDRAIRIFKKMENTTYAIKPEAQLGYAYALAGNHEIAKQYLKKVEVRVDVEAEISVSYDLALVHVGLGDMDKTFHYLEKCVNERIGQMIFVGQSPIWEGLKSDDRYDSLIKKIGLHVIN